MTRRWLAHDLAERLLAPWPQRPSPTGWRLDRQDRERRRALSRLDGRPAHGPEGARHVLALWGSGGPLKPRRGH